MARHRVAVDDEQVLTLYHELHHGPEVARRLGLGQTTVYRILQRHGEKAIGVPRMPKFRPPYKLTPAQESDLARRYAAGESMASLRGAFNCGAELIRNVAKRHGVLVRGRGNRYRAFTEGQVAEMAALWTSGLSQSRIAAVVGVHQTVVSHALARHGVAIAPRRPRGEAHGSWRGGRVVLGSGYIGVQVPPDDSLAVMRQRAGYVAEHRLVMARSLGRPLADRETVHHINGNKADNRLENLQLRTGKHGTGVEMVCLDCGSHNVAHAPLAEN